MITCSARFAIGLSFRTPARLDDDELELTRQHGYGNRKDGEMQRPETRSSTSPRTGHKDMPCKLPERGVEPGYSRMLSEIFEKVASGDSVSWQAFESSRVS